MTLADHLQSRQEVTVHTSRLVRLFVRNLNSRAAASSACAILESSGASALTACLLALVLSCSVSLPLRNNENSMMSCLCIYHVLFSIVFRSVFLSFTVFRLGTWRQQKITVRQRHRQIVIKVHVRLPVPDEDWCHAASAKSI